MFSGSSSISIGGRRFDFLLARQNCHEFSRKVSNIDHRREITISIGASEFGRDGDTLDSFLGVADQRLYRAKHEGRNCVIAA
jgi:PleD family two-component response regulator